MKTKHILISLFCLSVISWSCKDEEIVKAEVIKGGFNIDNIDKSVRPGDDFYQYAVGNWMKEHPGESLIETNYINMAEWYIKCLNAIINGEAEQTGTALEIKQVYDFFADAERRQATGTAPLLRCMKLVDKCTTMSQLTDALIKLIKDGHRVPFELGITSGNNVITGNSQYIIYINTGLIQPCISQKGTEIPEIYNLYKLYIRNMLTLTGYTDIDEDKFVSDILKTDNEFYACGADKTHEFLLKDVIPTGATDLFRLFRELNIAEDYTIVADNTEYLKVLMRLLADSSGLEQVKHYLIWGLILEGNSYLTEEILNCTDNFFAKISGTELEGLDGTSHDIVRGLYETELGKLYVEQNISKETLELVGRMAENIRTVFLERIQNAGWLDAETKTQALEKLEAISVYVAGSPLTRTVKSLPDNCYAYRLELQKKKMEKMYELYGNKPKPDNEFLYAYTINASYDSSFNSLNVLAGWLQIVSSTDIAYNYGIIGHILGHEFTHSLDANCRYYDKDGNRRDWWSGYSSANYDARGAQVANYYSTLTYGDNIPVDGKYTLGETIAELGGVSLAHEAMMREAGGKELLDENGLTLSQRFFLAYAYKNAGYTYDIPEVYKTDVHIYPPLRVNSTIANTDAWYKAFDIQPGDKWYIAPEKRVGLW